MFRRKRPSHAASPAAKPTPPGWHREDWQSYDGVAETYERVNAPRYAIPAADLVRLVAPPAGGRILDVGTGTGVAAIAAAEAVGAEGLAVGLDPARGMLALARTKGASVRWVSGEALDLPFRKGTFDAVVANFVVSHFTKYETALFDMVRVLRPRGRLGLSNWGTGEDEFGRAWREAAEALVGTELFRDARGRALPWQEKFSRPEEFEDALKEAGLRDVDIQQRDYRFEMTIESYLQGQETRMVARSMRRIMGDAIWERFRAKVREEFARRFREPIGDTRDVWFGVGTKP